MTFQDLLTPQEVDLLLNFAKSKEDWEDKNGEGFWSNRCLSAALIYDENKEAGKLLYDIRGRIKEKITSNMTNGVEVFSDLLQIVRWFPGMEQPPHADDMTDAGDGYEWFKHRHFGSIVYLNDNYSGGYTYYPKYEIAIVPKSGMLAVHPGDPDHLHGVTKIENEMRYTLASFWTYDKEYEYDWSIL